MKNNTQVEHPDYYNKHPSGIECIEIVRHCNFNIGNAIKYLFRCGLKDDNPQTQDLRKAMFYIQDEIKRLENKEEKEVPVLKKTNFNTGDIYYIDGKPVGVVVGSLNENKMLVLNLKHYKNKTWNQAQALFPSGCVDGWRLPCKAEADLLLMNKFKINDALKLINCEPFLKDSFWLSSEFSSDSAHYGSLKASFLMTGPLNKKERINVFSIMVVNKE